MSRAAEMREAGEGDCSLNARERHDLRRDVEIVECYKALSLGRAGAYAKSIRDLNGDLINRWDPTRRERVLSHEEAIDDFLAGLEACWDKLIDAEFVRRAVLQAETGRAE